MEKTKLQKNKKTEIVISYIKISILFKTNGVTRKMQEIHRITLEIAEPMN